MKQITSFMAINVNGSDRISYTFDTISDEGDLISTNETATFFVVDEGLRAHIEAIRAYIREHKLA